MSMDAPTSCQTLKWICGPDSTINLTLTSQSETGCTKISFDGTVRYFSHYFQYNSSGLTRRSRFLVHGGKYFLWHWPTDRSCTQISANWQVLLFTEVLCFRPRPMPNTCFKEKRYERPLTVICCLYMQWPPSTFACKCDIHHIFYLKYTNE